MTARLTPGVSREQFGPDVRGSVADAIERVPRHLFVPEERRMTSYLDASVPLGAGRRCPRPSLVARLLDAIGTGRGRVLVVGAGTGYVAACAAELAGDVVAVESDGDLLAQAAIALGSIRPKARVSLRQSLPSTATFEEAPFDAILVCAATEHTPRRLLATLPPDGTLVVPVRQEERCRLFSFHAAPRGHLRKSLGDVEVENLPAVLAAAC